MSKDEFNKRLIRKYPTPEKRRELYRKMVSSNGFENNKTRKHCITEYNNLSEPEQQLAIQKYIIQNTWDNYWMKLSFGILGGGILPSGSIKTIKSDHLSPALLTFIGLVGASGGYYIGFKMERLTLSLWMHDSGLDTL